MSQVSRESGHEKSFKSITNAVRKLHYISVPVKQVSLPNLKQVASSGVQKKVEMPAAEQAEVKPVKKEEEKPSEKKPKKEKVEKKGKDKNAGKQGKKWLVKLQLKCSS